MDDEDHQPGLPSCWDPAHAPQCVGCIVRVKNIPTKSICRGFFAVAPKHFGDERWRLWQVDWLFQSSSLCTRFFYAATSAALWEKQLLYSSSGSSTGPKRRNKTKQPLNNNNNKKGRFSSRASSITRQSELFTDWLARLPKLRIYI